MIQFIKLIVYIVDFSIHVLTAGSWPLTGSQTDFQLPSEVNDEIKTTIIHSIYSWNKASLYLQNSLHDDIMEEN